jgi:hypothetical protein
VADTGKQPQKLPNRSMSATLAPPMVHSIFGGDSPRARRGDPSTSHEAADTNDVSKSIGWVLQTLTRKSLADHELVGLAGVHGLPFTGQRLRTARAALVGLGFVEASGVYRMTESNRRAIVWAVTS